MYLVNAISILYLVSSEVDRKIPQCFMYYLLDITTPSVPRMADLSSFTRLPVLPERHQRRPRYNNTVIVMSYIEKCAVNL